MTPKPAQDLLISKVFGNSIYPTRPATKCPILQLAQADSTPYLPLPLVVIHRSISNMLGFPLKQKLFLNQQINGGYYLAISVKPLLFSLISPCFSKPYHVGNSYTMFAKDRLPALCIAFPHFSRPYLPSADTEEILPRGFHPNDEGFQ